MRVSDTVLKIDYLTQRRTHAPRRRCVRGITMKATLKTFGELIATLGTRTTHTAMAEHLTAEAEPVITSTMRARSRCLRHRGARHVYRTKP